MIRYDFYERRNRGGTIDFREGRKTIYRGMEVSAEGGIQEGATRIRIPFVSAAKKIAIIADTCVIRAI